jgi:hypothetical protein
MIKYSAKICAARWWMNVCNYLRLWIYVGLSISRMYVDQPSIDAGTNEIMKIVIARGLFKEKRKEIKK